MTSLSHLLESKNSNQVAEYLRSHLDILSHLVKSQTPFLISRRSYVVTFRHENLTTPNPFGLLTEQDSDRPAWFNDEEDAYEAAFEYAEYILEKSGNALNSEDSEAVDTDALLDAAADLAGECICVISL